MMMDELTFLSFVSGFLSVGGRLQHQPGGGILRKGLSNE